MVIKWRSNIEIQNTIILLIKKTKADKTSHFKINRLKYIKYLTFKTILKCIHGMHVF